MAKGPKVFDVDEDSDDFAVSVIDEVALKVAAKGVAVIIGGGILRFKAPVTCDDRDTHASLAALLRFRICINQSINQPKGQLIHLRLRSYVHHLPLERCIVGIV